MALQGARMMLLSGSEPGLSSIRHLRLASNPGFEEEYAACMSFPRRKTSD
jgi:hypothetical protein